MIPAPRHAVLIDDEPLARLELRRLLQAHPHVTIIGEAGTLDEARALLGRPGYDLVFLDVQLRGGSGFELLDGIAPGAEVIFVTAFDRYAVRAFEVNALDYLLKPVSAARIAGALQRLEAQPRGVTAVPAPPEAALTLDDRVFVRSGTTTRFVPVATICAVKSCENYTELLLLSGERVLVLRTLKSWEGVLPEPAFTRIHRQAIVNLARVTKIERAGEEELLFHLDAPHPALPASRRQIAEVRDRLKAAGLGGLLP